MAGLKREVRVCASIIGLGAMGMGMAKNMLAAGIAVKGYDVAEAARAAFAEIGGEAATDAADAARDANLLFVMVVDAAQARAVLFSDGGAAAALATDAAVVVCSTIAPTEVRELAAEVRQHGAWLVDAPVSGGKVGADAGTLTVMASGAEAAMAQARPALEAVSKKIHYLGETPGLGATYKVVHQLAAGVHLVAAAEVMALGAKAGCDLRVLSDIVSSSAGQSWMFDDRVPHILEGDYAPRSCVDIFVKDLGLVLQEGEALAMPLPLSEAAHRQLVAAAEMGLGRLDDSAVVKAYGAQGAIDDFA